MEKEKTSSAPPGDAQASRADTALAAAAPTSQSWGEKYGASTLSFTRNWVINYFINFMIGAVVAYKFDTSKYGKGLRQWIHDAGGKSTIMSPDAARYVLNLATRNQFLLVGGHALLPVLKVMKDHQRQLSLWFEHKIDQLQEFTGNGSEASKRSLGEYGRIRELRSAAKNGAASELSATDEEMLARHEIDNKLQFEEHRESWGRIIKARLIGMTFSTAASGGLGWLSGQKHIPALQYKRRLETPFGAWAAKNIINKVPFLRSFFAAQPNLIGEYFMADAILTTVSAGVYRAVEKADEKRELEKEANKKGAEEAKPTVSHVTRDGVVTQRDAVLNHT